MNNKQALDYEVIDPNKILEHYHVPLYKRIWRNDEAMAWIVAAVLAVLVVAAMVWG